MANIVITSQDVANQALYLMGGNQELVSAGAPNFDDSTAGLALQQLYAPCVESVAKEFGWDFARNTVALSLTANTPLDPRYTLEYTYPGNGVEVWQLLPPTLSDPNNPTPIRWTVANNLVASVQTKVIWTTLANALANYNNAPTEATWDVIFREAVVRLLASELSTALAGKPDTAGLFLQTSGSFEEIGETRNG
jgi:hypothetical protein